MEKTYSLIPPRNKDETGSENRSIPIKNLYILLASCVAISLFFVIFMWGFFSRDIFALGFNTTIFIFLFFWLSYRIFPEKKLLRKNNLAWMIPLFLIALSFSIFENPFLKIFSLLVFPVTFIIFYNYARLENREGRQWDFSFFISLISRTLDFFVRIPSAIGLYNDLALSREKKRSNIVRKILLGVILFLLLAFFIVIPLLSSADPLFAAKMHAIMEKINEIISLDFVSRAAVFYILSVFFLALTLSWLWPFRHREHASAKKDIDSIVTGIVLGGTLALYLLFLYLQINRLWVNALPIDFKETEDLVKSGFWQLFVLSVINILIFFFSFRKTNPIVQRILTIFTAASFLLLLSAGYRMGLYVTFYGLSYEKFFASYTVIYIGILFFWIFARFFNQQKPNIMKFILFLFLWMFAIATVLPVEQFILRTNVKLAERPDSRIKIFELTMLSPDVLKTVQAHVSKDSSKCVKKEPTKDQNIINNDFCDWDKWIEKIKKIEKEKKWYEYNVINVYNKL